VTRAAELEPSHAASAVRTPRSNHARASVMSNGRPFLQQALRRMPRAQSTE
jgi:hypothetical protein